MLENQVQSISKEKAAEMLRLMYETRAFEEQAEKSYMMGKIHGTMHLSIGQEGSAIGSISTLEPDDFILGHHRGRKRPERFTVLDFQIHRRLHLFTARITDNRAPA